MKISIIVAVDNNNAIGNNGDQLAYISGDLKRFKQLTTSHAIVMGRKTFEALPKGALPNRENIVITRQQELKFNGCTVVNTVEQAIEHSKTHSELFIIGGGEIYTAFLPLATDIYLTQIQHEFANADTWFPQLDENEWSIVSKEENIIDEKTGLTYSYINLARKSN